MLTHGSSSTSVAPYKPVESADPADMVLESEVTNYADVSPPARASRYRRARVVVTVYLYNVYYMVYDDGRYVGIYLYIFEAFFVTFYESCRVLMASKVLNQISVDFGREVEIGHLYVKRAKSFE